jgi:uncharacterized membrane protein
VTVSDGFLLVLTLVTTLGTGLFAGLFFTFSAFAMPALGGLPVEQSTTALFALNRAMYRNRLFVLVTLATVSGCIAAVATALVGLDRPGAALRLAGASLFLLGTAGTTVIYHLPQNNAVADINPAGLGAEARWRRFIRGWIAWNHVRVVTALVASALLTLSLH